MGMGGERKNNQSFRRTAFAFIVLMALVSMLSDVTHEGANSILGDYESFLGASAFVISVVSGLGLFIGYSLRLLTGYLADRTKKYWLFTLIGYAVDLISIPLLAAVPVNGWLLACLFVLLEKTGKAIKKPAKNTLVSFAAKSNGTGKSFAFSELLDQIGAFLGPIVLTLTYLFNGSLGEYEKYRLGFLVLGIPAFLCLVLLLVARLLFKNPESFEKENPNLTKKRSLRKASFVIFCLAGGCLAFGYIGYPLALKHIADLNLFDADVLPLLYSYAMLIDALSALAFGFLYDRFGLWVIALSSGLSAASSFFLFLIPSIWSIFVGLTLWGIGEGALESVVMSGVTDLSDKGERAKAFGLFDTVFGVFSFLGSLLAGGLFDFSLLWMCLASSSFAFLAAFLFVAAGLKKKKEDRALIPPPLEG